MPGATDIRAQTLKLQTRTASTGLRRRTQSKGSALGRVRKITRTTILSSLLERDSKVQGSQIRAGICKLITLTPDATDPFALARCRKQAPELALPSLAARLSLCIWGAGQLAYFSSGHSSVSSDSGKCRTWKGSSS